MSLQLFITFSKFTETPEPRSRWDDECENDNDYGHCCVANVVPIQNE